MPVPSAYTEEQLASYLHGVLGRVAQVLGWEPPASYAEVITDTLLAYGVADIADATDVQRLRVLGRRAVWRAAVAALAAHIDVRGADGQDVSESQLQAQALEALRLAEAEAAAYEQTDYTATIMPVETVTDPYTYRPDQERRWT